ncbi:hypothetical protein [Hoylesella saccharolytica]|uniref:hypothetical protein n=1 Tax=Hoylesella saccharolytica TaxID=633701 RepID=UPI0028E3F549|nr:hypothetical protein [Hoylesella saccharolytica]
MNLFTPRRPRRFHHEYIYSDERKALLETIRNKAKQTKTSSKAYCNKAEQDKTHLETSCSKSEQTKMPSKAYCNKAEQDKTHLENVQNKVAQSFTATDTHPTYHQTLRGAFASQLKHLQHTNNALRTPLHATSVFIFLLILTTLTLVIYLFG